MTSKAIPSGYHTITPYLTVTGADSFITFLKRAFAAREKERFCHPDGSIGHAEMIVGDSVIMLSQATSDCPPVGGAFYLYLEDVDAVYRQALAVGARSTAAPADQFWGDRTATVHDDFGNIWHLATRVENVSLEELQRRAAG